MNKYETARVHFEEARPVFAAIGHRRSEANCIRVLGDVYRMLGEYEAARAHFEEACPIFATVGDRHGLATTLAHLGLTYQRLKQPDQARDHLEQAIGIFLAIKSPYLGLVRGWLANLESDG